MKRTNSQKGITLVALIITIVLLLILAVVTIQSIQGDGIIAHAKNARTQYDQAQVNEQEKLLELEYQIAEAKGTAGSYDEFVLDKKYGLKIGDKVNYNEGTEGAYSYTVNPNTGLGANDEESIEVVEETFENENLSWRVLGINSMGQIELISEDVISKPIAMKSSKAVEKAVSTENNKGVLDILCDELYGNGFNGASARSLNANDINKLANYIPEENPEYGDVIYKYDYDENLYYYSFDEGKTWKTSYDSDDMGRESSSRTFNGEEVTRYSYKLYERIKQESSDGIKLADLLSKNCWLATKMTGLNMSDSGQGFVENKGIAVIKTSSTNSTNYNQLAFESFWDIDIYEEQYYGRPCELYPSCCNSTI